MTGHNDWTVIRKRKQGDSLDVSLTGKLLMKEEVSSSPSLLLQGGASVQYGGEHETEQLHYTPARHHWSQPINDEENLRRMLIYADYHFRLQSRAIYTLENLY
jgi:hypothetical protein